MLHVLEDNNFPNMIHGTQFMMLQTTKSKKHKKKKKYDPIDPHVK